MSAAAGLFYPNLDKRALLAQVAHRIVRVLAAESSEFTAALFLVARERKVKWELQEWEAVLADIDACELTVGEWLAKEAAR